MNDFDNIYIEAKVCRNHFKNQSITTNNKLCHSCAKKSYPLYTSDCIAYTSSSATYYKIEISSSEVINDQKCKKSIKKIPLL